MKDLVCPNCGSEQIDYSSLTIGSTKTIIGLGIPEMYFCPDCGYEGPVIMEIDQKHLKEVHFPRKKFKARKFDKHSADILKPIFTIVILVFVLITALAFIPNNNTRYYSEDLTPLPDNYLDGKEVVEFHLAEMPQFDGAVLVEKIDTGETIIEVQEPEPPELDVKLGTESVHSFIWPLFMTIFVIGFIGLMIAKHYERSLKFI